MSRKAKEQKTIEELLDDAIVPVEEHPYKVPENWVWSKLNSYYSHVNEQIQPEGNENYIGLENLLKCGGVLDITTAEGVKSKKVVFKSGDVLYGKLRPYLNKHAFVEFSGVASTDILVYRSKSKTSSKLLDHYLGLTHVVQFANANSSGINLPRVSPKTMNSLPFPLPPLGEQKRIAEKVERLLNKIDEAKQLIEEARETFELRRASILDKAFRGELTEQWRGGNKEPLSLDEFLHLIKEGKEKNNRSTKKETILDAISNIPYELPQGWKWVRLGDISNITMGQSPKGDSYNDEGKGIPLINGPVEFGPTPFSRTKKIKWTTAPTKECEEGDLLICVRGSTTGRMNIAGFKSCIGRGVASIHSPLIQDYINYRIHAIQQRIYDLGTGSTFPNISKDKLENLLIELPPQKELEEIVLLLKVLLPKEEEALEYLNTYSKSSEEIKQSILSKAFSGELGTNDPTEESSIELLKKVLKEQSNKK